VSGGAKVGDLDCLLKGGGKGRRESKEIPLHEVKRGRKFRGGDEHNRRRGKQGAIAIWLPTYHIMREIQCKRPSSLRENRTGDKEGRRNFQSKKKWGLVFSKKEGGTLQGANS